MAMPGGAPVAREVSMPRVSATRLAAASAPPSPGRLPAAQPPAPVTAAGPVATRTRRRAAWPTMTFTVLALLAVVGVLLLTGGASGTAARFGVQASPSEISLTAGDTAPITITLSAQHGFTATVTLTTSSLPPGVQLDLDRRSVPVSAAGLSVSGRLRTSSSAAGGTVGIEVIGRSGKATGTSLIQLHILAGGTTDPATSPPVVSSRADFTVSGSPRGLLHPGGSLPIDLRLVNANPFELSVDGLTVAVAGTSKSSCRVANFVIVPYRGGYPLRVPAGTTSTLSSLRVPVSQWPQLRMRPQAARTTCQGATVRLRYAGTGSAS
ncbi:MAG TPA: hypothetical protein VFU36_01350 [Jatrophihabitans sp.]|nr:hypothetical protein [Jatrophihabitans sp.]